MTMNTTTTITTTMFSMLDEFGAEIEHADSKLDATVKKMAKVLHLSNGNFFFLLFY